MVAGLAVLVATVPLNSWVSVKMRSCQVNHNLQKKILEKVGDACCFLLVTYYVLK